MLRSLTIRDFAIVDSLELDLAGGFTALTGETGAGKSILIDALQFVLGERAEPGLVREGAARAEVAALFDAAPAIRAWLEAAGFEGGEEGAVLVRRTLDAGGRSRAFLDGGAATAAQLRELGEMLLDVHGQHAHQSLLRPAAQQELLDEHGGLGAKARELAGRFAAWRHAQQELARAVAEQAQAREQRERLQDIAGDLAALAPEEGEWEKVEAEQRRLAHGAALLEGAREALEALDEAQESVTGRLARTHARLHALTAFDARLAGAAEAVSAAHIQAGEATRELQRYLDASEFDERSLARSEARLSALHAAARRWRCAPAELAQLLARTREQLALLEESGGIEALQAREAAAHEDYLVHARALSRERAGAARAMEREVSAAMSELSMQGARLEVKLHEADPGPGGLERVEFLIGVPGAGAARSLARVASGGELSRIGLAISVVAAQATPVPTLVFDEVDAGIGGQVASVVGQLLRRLGASRQVLCVTHLPQVASCADHHLAVDKESDGRGLPRSRTRTLASADRIEEIARMLGGAKITELTREHAREMLGR